MDSTPKPAASASTVMAPPAELAGLLTRARSLQRAAKIGSTQLLLRGRKYGVLRGTDQALDEDATLFVRAAVELGAGVAHVRPQLTEHSSNHEVRQTAELLALLYDAVICVDMSDKLVKRIALESGIPVYDCLMSRGHSLQEAAKALDPEGCGEDIRQYVVQAMLLGTTR